MVLQDLYAGLRRLLKLSTALGRACATLTSGAAPVRDANPKGSRYHDRTYVDHEVGMLGTPQWPSYTPESCMDPLGKKEVLKPLLEAARA